MQLYQNFVAGFAHKINLLKLAFFAVAVGKQMGSPEVRPHAATSALWTMSACSLCPGLQQAMSVQGAVDYATSLHSTFNNMAAQRAPETMPQGPPTAANRRCSQWCPPPLGCCCHADAAHLALFLCYSPQEGSAFIRDVISNLEASKQRDTEQPILYLRMQLAQYALVQVGGRCGCGVDGQATGFWGVGG